MDAIEQRRAELPFAELILTSHRQIHHELERLHQASEAAVEAWRAALARRWEYEIHGRRLYKQSLRQIADYLGEDAPQIQMISRGGDEANSTPLELLQDLRRVQACLLVAVNQLPFATERSEQIEALCSALEQAIDAASLSAARRRDAALDYRMAREAFRRVAEETFGKLSAHYGERFMQEFHPFFDSAAA
jgi:hypothetical protein